MWDPAKKAGSSENEQAGVSPTSQEEVPPEALGAGGDGSLPVEPSVPWAESDEGFVDSAWDARSVHRRLLAFTRHGLREKSAPIIAGECRPALLHAYRDLSHFRHDYPLLFPAGDDEPAAIPLTAVIDSALERIEADGDEGQRLERHALQLEGEIGALAEADPGGSLTELRDLAVSRLLARTSMPGDKRRMLEEDFARLCEQLDQEGPLFACDAGIPRRLGEAALAVFWRRQRERWWDTIDRFVLELEDMILADDSHASSARSSEGLRNSVGRPASEDMDFDRMSEILADASLGEPLPPERRRRLDEALSYLRAMLDLLDSGHSDAGRESQPAISLRAVPGDCREAMVEYERRRSWLVGFIRAMRIAELEVANAYEAEKHDEFFARFDSTHLTQEELALCPPILLELDQEDVGAAGLGELSRLLVSGAPVKVILELDTLFTQESGSGAIVPTPAARLASMATAFGDVFVLQCPVSKVSLMEEGFGQGLSYPGPALFCLYAGAPDSEARRDRFVAAAAAADCRALPVFRYDPARGESLAERMSVDGNTDPGEDWATAMFRYEKADGSAAEVELAFTLADFLLDDSSLSGCFWPVPPSLWHPEMLPLRDFLDGEDMAETKIPCLVAVADDGQVVRVVVQRSVLDAARRCASHWRLVRENGGVNNSHALALLAREKERLAEEKSFEVAEIEKRYEERLDVDIGELTKAIVGRIATRLLSGDAVASPLPAARESAPAAPAERETGAESEAPSPAVEEPEAEKEEDEEAFSLDEPYIDTPLCTTCDDCTNMSPGIFAYDENKQAYIKDASAGTYRELVLAAEKCPVRIIHPGKPADPDEPNLEEWIERAKPYL